MSLSFNHKKTYIVNDTINAPTFTSNNEYLINILHNKLMVQKEINNYVFESGLCFLYLEKKC